MVKVYTDVFRIRRHDVMIARLDTLAADISPRQAAADLIRLGHPDRERVLGGGQKSGRGASRIVAYYVPASGYLRTARQA